MSEYGTQYTQPIEESHLSNRGRIVMPVRFKKCRRCSADFTSISPNAKACATCRPLELAEKNEKLKEKRKAERQRNGAISRNRN